MNEREPEPEYVTAEFAARALQVGRSTIYMWIAQGLIPTFRLNRVIRIPRSALMQMVEERVQRTTTAEETWQPVARGGPKVSVADLKDGGRDG